MPIVNVGRRDLLRGLGTGAVLLAPFARNVKAWAAGKPTPNLMIFYTPNGHVRSAFGATGSGAAFTLKSSLATLEPFKAKVSIVSNLDNPGASAKGSHEDCVRSLTCMPGSDIYRGYGPSIDWVVASSLQSRPLTMSSSWKRAPNWQTKISWKQDNVYDAHLDDASAIYGDLFAKVMPSQNAGEVQRTVAQGKSVLDFVRGDIAALRPRLAAPERAKLDNHMDALRELEGSLAAAPSGAACSTTAARAKVDAGTAGGSGGDSLRKAIELKVELAATAFACGIRRVATLLAQGSSDGMNPLGGIGHHNISHGEGPVMIWQSIDSWYAERFAGLLKRLSDLQLLDSTVVAWCTEIAEQHTQRGFVIPVAGGSALGIQSMQTLSSKDTLSNLWVSVQKAMGVPRDTFGTASSGGIPGLWKAV